MSEIVTIIKLSAAVVIGIAKIMERLNNVVLFWILTKQETSKIVCVSQISEQFSSFIKAPPNGDREALLSTPEATVN